jgi:hypothetical protein
MILDDTNIYNFRKIIIKRKMFHEMRFKMSRRILGAFAKTWTLVDP